MKLRIRGNSLRLRLSRGEVGRFGATGRITETIQFGESQWSYSLKSRSEAQTIRASFSGNRLTVIIPDKTARNRVESERISLTNDQLFENGASENVLQILIEKDFVCLDRKNDPDNADDFPHQTGKCV